jgi:amidophosphoribosyltransferase
MEKIYIMSDKMHDECGVMGIYNPDGDDVSQYIYYGLYSLQHRGQESCGMALYKEEDISYFKRMGLVSEVFNNKRLSKLPGNVGIGHVRYSTTGESAFANIQPLAVKYRKGSIALAHNGNLVNADSIREMLEEEGVIFQTTVDTEVIANLLARYHKNEIESAMRKVLGIVKGAYSLVILIGGSLIGVRDTYGIRPLCLGKIGNSYVLASETCALDTIGADFIREIEPGEMVIINQEGIKSVNSDKLARKASCIFEHVYFARPDSILDGINAHTYRFKTGKILAEEAPVEADMVIAVPDSGVPAAIGFSEASGIPYGVGLIKNRYIGRTFIQPNQQLREQAFQICLYPKKIKHQNYQDL